MPEDESLNWIGEKGVIIEPLFADYFLSLHPMRCFHNILYGKDGIVDDESVLLKEIYELIRDFAKTNVAKKSKQLLDAVKLACASEQPGFRRIGFMWRTARIFWTVHSGRTRNIA